MIVGIVVALPEEVGTLTRQKLVQGECLALNDTVLLNFAGVGPVNAAKAAQCLLDQGAQRLISWGCAAAISAELNPGDLVLPTQVVPENEPAFEIDTDWSNRVSVLLAGKRVLARGALAESTTLVADSRNKQILGQQTGAVALDMESVAVAKIAKQARVPCLIVRAIADPVNMDLPKTLANALNEQGQVELSKLLGLLVKHPWEIPALIKLGLHFNAARKTLGAAASQLMLICN